MATCDTSEGALADGSPRTHAYSALEPGGAELAIQFWSGDPAGEGVEFSTP
ncbi:hypothetical protein NYP18_02795 [Corynebacterium sp. YIM 101645]|uniref:Uncharacterized protein n=1 Tax=Corynebacterium lemuris TaxID=1859292 RepID=A0ABT2FTN3_9CORY|nr:hypothetical protein [Corynebacterium lemuris]MCS5478577.1 hypothetical protein [Corynebacterium lemuris]